MDFTEVECALCGRTGYRMGMVRMKTSLDPSNKSFSAMWRCPDGQCALPKSPDFPFNRVPLRVVKEETAPAPVAHPLQEEFGFKKPEDGSGQRYATRRATTPWARHTFWWILHNAVAHPLIAFVPVRVFFRFHDWTSRRMHGQR